jgi:outer membrane receptor protein involved in Fe transport
VAGFTDVNDQTRVVATPNPNLRPETSDNLSARLAYYFEPVGVVAVNVFQNDVKDLMITNSLTAAQYGYTGPEDYSTYTFNTTTNSPGTTRIRGLEIEYAQSLSFLPGALRGLGVRASYTHNYAQIIVPGLGRHKLSGGINYALGRVSANVNALWDDDVPLNTADTSYRRHRATLDAGASFKLTAQTSVFVSARNLTNSRYITMDRFAPAPAVWRAYERYGTTWTFGVKGAF